MIDNFAKLRVLIMSPDPQFTSFSFLALNSATVRNIIVVLGRIIEQLNVECPIQEWHSSCLHF